MKKASLEQFINRYNLGGEVESVKITSTDSEMKVSFISDDKTLLGEVTSKEGEFPNGEFGVYTTSQLKALLGVLESSMDVDSRCVLWKNSFPLSNMSPFFLFDIDHPILCMVVGSPRIQTSINGFWF